LREANQNPYVFIAEGGSPFIHTGVNKRIPLPWPVFGDQFRFFINDQELTNKIMRIPPAKLEEFKKYNEGGNWIICLFMV